MQRINDARRGFWLASLSFLPLVIWWLGWFPAFLSPDSIDQLEQVESGEFSNGHPAIHTIAIWTITRVWDHPGAVTLIQIVAIALLLGVVARRLIELGVPMAAAVGAAWLAAVSPAVGPTVMTIWKDVAFTAAFLWVFAELLLLVRLRAEFWTPRWNPLRLGIGLGLVWLVRHNGVLTVLPVLAVVAIVYRAQLRRVGLAAAAVAGTVALVLGPLYWVFSVDTGRPAPGEVLLPVVASSYVHEPGNFSEDDLALLASIAPLEVWVADYDCATADPLLFADDLDIEVIRRDPGPFLSLGIRTVLRDPDTSVGFFACRASYLFTPVQPADTYLHRPPFAIPANDLGIERSPVWQTAYDATLEVFQTAESDGWLWLTWRPALVVWATLLTYAALARPSTRLLLVPGSLWGAHLLNVMATSLNHEFRLVLPLYVAGIMSWPLLWFVFHAEQLDETGSALVTSRRSLLDDDIAAIRDRERQSEGVE
ncbi:MAG: hypothetical protein ACR2OI_11560 [Acidimicrobiia bacterium]